MNRLRLINLNKNNKIVIKFFKNKMMFNKSLNNFPLKIVAKLMK